MKTIALEKGRSKKAKGEVKHLRKKGSNEKGMEQRCVVLHYFVASFLRHSLYRCARQPRRNGSNGRMHVLFSSFFSPFLAFLPESRREKKGWKATPYLRRSASLLDPIYPYLLFSLPPLLFYLRSKTGRKPTEKTGEAPRRKGAVCDCKFNDNTTKDVYTHKKNMQKCSTFFQNSRRDGISRMGDRRISSKRSEIISLCFNYLPSAATRRASISTKVKPPRRSCSLYNFVTSSWSSFLARSTKTIKTTKPPKTIKSQMI